MTQGPFKVASGVALVSEQEFENFRLRIIERCAQVAEQWKQGGSTESSGIAAAIRKLKTHDTA